MVVCAYPDASKIGVDILKKGGNAVDAAVAVQFALAVVHPSAGNIGGGGFMVFRSSKGETNTLDFREKAPDRATTNMYLDAEGNIIPDLSLASHLASGVPGSVDGMVEAHHKYGKLKWADLVQPAIDLATNGYKITARLAGELNRTHDAFIKANPGKPYALVKDEQWKEDDVLVQADLAKTLELIRDNGRAGFYGGRVANEIVAEMKLGNGLISKTDLANYHAVWRKAIKGSYKNYNIITMPPPSSGGIALLQLLKSVEKYPLHRWGYNQDSTVRLIVEAERRVYADRSTYLGDPDFYKVPVDSLLRPAYIDSRMSSFSWNAATSSSSIQAGKFVGYESDQTTHYSIVDKDGNAVAITTTLNGSYGSKIFVGGAGFLLNNEMDDFSSKPGTPNMYGLIGGRANRIQPGKRMLSCMTPTIVEKDGKLFMVVGTPGGATIITSVFQTILNVIEFDMNMQDAVAAKRFHHQWLPDNIQSERGALNAGTRTKLEKKGYPVKEQGAIGRVDGILKTKEGYEGGADPRGDDTKLGCNFFDKIYLQLRNTNNKLINMPGSIKHQETIDYFLKVVWQTVANRYNALVTDFGITQSIGYLLINIDEEEGTTVSQAAALLGLKSTSLSRMLNQLEKIGLIYRESNSGDKRSVKIYLTPLGKEKRQQARAVVKEFNNYLNVHISEADKVYLTDMLKKINQLTLNYKPETR